jgi:hypothetical protein
MVGGLGTEVRQRMSRSLYEGNLEPHNGQVQTIPQLGTCHSGSLLSTCLVLTNAHMELQNALRYAYSTPGIAHCFLRDIVNMRAESNPKEKGACFHIVCMSLLMLIKIRCIGLERFLVLL